MTKAEMVKRSACYAATMFVLSYVFNLNEMIEEQFGSRPVFVFYHATFFFLLLLGMQIYRDWRDGRK